MAHDDCFVSLLLFFSSYFDDSFLIISLGRAFLTDMMMALFMDSGIFGVLLPFLMSSLFGLGVFVIM